MSTLLLTGGTIVSSQGQKQSDVLLEDGLITRIGNDLSADPSASLRTSETKDVSGKLLFPGLIDCHVHFREPGFEHKATMQSESIAARAGGVTTVCDMPNTNPPTVTIDALRDKEQSASVVTDCDIRFYFGVTESSHLEELRKLWENGSGKCCGLKLYLDHSTGDQKVDGEIVGEIFKTCAELKIPIIAHCEDPQMNATALESNTDEDVSAHSKVRPAESEEKSIKEAIDYAREYGAALHIAHLSTAGGIESVRQAKKEGLPVTCETAPHHLFLSTDDYGKLGTFCKMNPPVRDPHHREALWEGIVDGTVDCISTDHAPHTVQEKKEGAPLSAPSGVTGVETMLPLLLTVAAGKWPHPEDHPPISITPERIIELCHTNPNRIFNLEKEEIEEQSQSSIVIVDPEDEWKISASDLHYKCGWTPYEGWQVQGKVEEVL